VSEYIITMQRAATITDAEARVRLVRVYRLLIARCRETADGVKAGNPKPLAAGNARLQATGEYNTMSAKKQTPWQNLAPMIALAARQRNWRIYTALTNLLKRWEQREGMTTIGPGAGGLPAPASLPARLC
jgi:hypothetical protein